MATFYLCTGENPCCGHSAGCYLSGGDCKHTTHPEYAKTPECKDPWKHPERFEAENVSDCPTYYFEREENDIHENNLDGEESD